MSNYAWVCFACKTAGRRPGNAGNVKCASCAQPCECIGKKIPIPPKSKPKEWDALRVSFFTAKHAHIVEKNRALVRRKHDLEHGIERLSVMPMNGGRNQAIKELQKRLGELTLSPSTQQLTVK